MHEGKCEYALQGQHQSLTREAHLNQEHVDHFFHMLSVIDVWNQEDASVILEAQPKHRIHLIHGVKHERKLLSETHSVFLN